MRAIWLLVLAAVLVVGCSSATVEPTRLVAEPAVEVRAPVEATPGETPLVTESGAEDALVPYPGPAEIPSNDPYPGPAEPHLSPTATAEPTSDLVARVMVPSPAPGLATVTGVLQYRDAGGQDLAAQYVRVFLARRLRNVEGQPSFMVSLSKANAPMTITDGEGRFAFGEVQPDYYALVIESGKELSLAVDLMTNQEVLVETSADQLVDLGEIVIKTR